MADLSTLIRLHKHELDEKRQALGALYAELAALERQRREIERAFEREKAAVSADDDIHFTFASYVEATKLKFEDLRRKEEVLEKKIEEAKESLMESFSELKKYEMTQAERERLEEEERSFRETQSLDAIGIEGYRRRQDEDK